MSPQEQSGQPPGPNAKLRATILAGVGVVLAAPFLSDGAAYLEGRHLQPFLAADVWLMLAWAFVGCGTFIVMVTSRSWLPPVRQRYRLLLAFGLLCGGPVYFFLMSRPPAAPYLRGLADAARRRVDLTVLQRWAVETLRQSPDASRGAPDWSTAPADARSFLEQSRTSPVVGVALIRTNEQGRLFIELAAGSRRLLVGGTNLAHTTDPYWNCELRPGIYLQHRLRP
jgi:hypothetical protein